MAKPTIAIGIDTDVLVRSSGTAGRRATGYRLLVDRAARVIIGLGGVTIVVVILAILGVLLIEVAPLFQSPVARRAGSVNVPRVASPSTIGVDEYRELAYVVSG